MTCTTIMAPAKANAFHVPGLDKSLTTKDLLTSNQIYNGLPVESEQPKPTKAHLDELHTIFVRNGAVDVFGLHLIHRHFPDLKNKIMLGTPQENPSAVWTRQVDIDTINVATIRGHIFMLAHDGFHPYEYRQGSLCDWSRINNAFLSEVAEYLEHNELGGLLGLQLLDLDSAHHTELILPDSTVMLKCTDLLEVSRHRDTGWRFEDTHDDIRTCQANEQHGQTRYGHEVYNQGSHQPRFDNYSDVTYGLRSLGILRSVSQV